MFDDQAHKWKNNMKCIFKKFREGIKHFYFYNINWNQSDPGTMNYLKKNLEGVTFVNTKGTRQLSHKN